MPKPRLNGAKRYSVLLPAGCACLAKAMKVDVLADRLRLAGDFRLLFAVVLSKGNRGATLPTVQSRVQSNPFQLPQEVVVGFVSLVHKNPAVGRMDLPPCFESVNEAHRKRNGSALV